MPQLLRRTGRESIRLRRDAGGGLIAAVTINGEPIDMVVDTGASIISLPSAIAARIGVEPKPSDREITLELADGSLIDAMLTNLAEVQVGNHRVKNVACAILDPKADRAPPLLGMSFLGRFQTDIDPSGPTMRLVRITQ